MMKNAWALCAAMLLCVVAEGSSAATPPRVASDNARRSVLDLAVDAAVAGFFRDTCHVGLSLAVVNRDGDAYYNYGSTRRGAARLPDKRSLYEIASVTKTFTGALVARAIVDRRVALDGDFRAYLPASYPNLSRSGTPITARSLVTHRSGLPRDIPDTDAIFAKKDFDTLPQELLALQENFDQDTLLSALHDVTLRTAPGDKEAYSNTGFFVLGLGLAKVYGQPVEALMHRNILQPLGMASTGFVVAPANRSRLVRPYDRNGHLVPYHPRNAGTAWGLYSTTADMAKYVRWQLDAGDPVIRVMRQPLVGTAQDGVAMTWNLATEDDQPTLSHGGGSFGMSSEVLLYPERHEGFALLANDACAGTEAALKAMAESIHSRDHAGNAVPRDAVVAPHGPK